MTSRIALIVSYDGSGFHGFQFQNDTLPTVQLCLEQALGRVANHEVSIVCAGRTDAGVHATCQIVHFDTTALRSDSAWMHGTNRYLGSDVAVQWSGPVWADFSARFSAVSRRYLYLILNTPVRSPLLARQMSWFPRKLDADLMQQAAHALVGEHDFSSFRAASCSSKTPYRNVQSLQVTRKGDMLVIDISANAFLHHMVRNIVGALVEVGVGSKPGTWIPELLSARDRRLAGRTASPHGLYLVGVTYPEEAGIPVGSRLPHLYSSLASW